MTSSIRQFTLAEVNVIQPTEEPNTHKINLKALVFNFVFLYGIGASAEIVPHFVGSFKRGFFCDDETIMYPFRDSTVSATVMFTYCILLNVLAILAVEYYRIMRFENNTEQPRYQFKNSTIHHFIVRCMTYFAYSQIGFVSVLVLTNVTKSVAGRLRPHFLDVCKPIDANCTINEHRFVPVYTCSGDPSMVEEARKSFFSGHSSFSMYATVWAILYIQARLRMAGGNRIMIPLIQTVLLATGLSICYSRVSDFKHHWSDVIVGIFAGSFVAVYSCVFWCEMFKKEHNKENSSLLPNRTGSFMLVDGRSSNSSPAENLQMEPDVEQGPSFK